jgi:hypothetical protein
MHILAVRQYIPVGEEGDLVSRHDDGSSVMLLGLVCQPHVEEDVKEACPFAGIIQIKFAGISQIDHLLCPLPTGVLP